MVPFYEVYLQLVPIHLDCYPIEPICEANELLRIEWVVIHAWNHHSSSDLVCIQPVVGVDDPPQMIDLPVLLLNHPEWVLGRIRLHTSLDQGLDG